MAGPRTTVEAQAFYRMYHSYADIPNPWDRLRWCRYGLDLLQKEVAAMVGMEEWLYRDLESGTFHRSFTPELADKLAALYGIPVEDILDDYTLFLHRGGGAFLRRYREAKGWNRQQLADHAKVKARLQATICGSADGLSLWNHSVSIILIFALTYMAFRKTRSRSSNVAFHAGCSENTVCST